MIHTVIYDIDNTMYSFDRDHGKAMEALFEHGNSALFMNPEPMKAAGCCSCSRGLAMIGMFGSLV